MDGQGPVKDPVSRISKEEYFRKLEKIYRWDLVSQEKEIMCNLARGLTGRLVLENWELFQKRFPGHPAWEFEEWMQMNLQETEEENDENTDSETEERS